MSIKTYEIHNSYLQDAPDSTGITRMVSEADYLSQDSRRQPKQKR
ncbi:hypothetical protein [Rahnella sp. NRRL B-41462]|nr:hypothetical protein [Rahnella sp. NRRL B-41462]